MALSVAASVVLNAVIPPIVVYALFLAGMMATYGRPRPPRRREAMKSSRPPSPSRLARYLLATALAGYLCFLVLDVVFFFALGGQPTSFLGQALTGGAWLAFGIAVPVFFLLGWIEWRFRGRSPKRPQE